MSGQIEKSIEGQTNPILKDPCDYRCRSKKLLVQFATELNFLAEVLRISRN